MSIKNDKKQVNLCLNVKSWYHVMNLRRTHLASQEKLTFTRVLGQPCSQRTKLVETVNGVNKLPSTGETNMPR